MSVEARDKHAGAAKKTKTVDSLTAPKKRKHDADDRESSKKRKKPRTEEKTETTVSEQPAANKEKKKKNTKKVLVTEEDKTPVQPSEEVLNLQDVELQDATITEPELAEETGTRLLDDVEDDAQDLDFDEEDDLKLLESEEPTSFFSTRLSLYLSIPAISLESGTSSILATHLAPLLLTYFPPARGIVLAFSDPVISAKPNSGLNLAPLPPQTDSPSFEGETFAGTADEFGVCCVWLTVTLLLFRPQKGDTLHGWTNVTSEGFVGLVSYNYFQTAVGKSRIPSDWRWIGPTADEVQRSRKRGKKARLRGEDGADNTQETEATLIETQSPQIQLGDDVGYFADATGNKVQSTLEFRVVDTEIVPAHERHKWSLQIGGTLLDEAAEEMVMEEERAEFERVQHGKRSKPPRFEVEMSGGLSRSMSREGSVASRVPGQTLGRYRPT